MRAIKGCTTDGTDKAWASQLQYCQTHNVLATAAKAMYHWMLRNMSIPCISIVSADARSICNFIWQAARCASSKKLGAIVSSKATACSELACHLCPQLGLQHLGN